MGIPTISGGKRTTSAGRAGPWTRVRRGLGRLLALDDLELALLALKPPALQLCSDCATGFVIPTRWEPLDGGRWRIELRCSACGEFREVVTEDQLAGRFAEAVTMSSAHLDRSLHRPAPQSMARWAATFTNALERDLVGPMDFGGPTR